jgi:hypothetical protein
MGSQAFIARDYDVFGGLDGQESISVPLPIIRICKSMRMPYNVSIL